MSENVKTSKREELIESVKRLAKSIEENAVSIVGNVDCVTDIDIWLKFPHDAMPYYTVTKDYLPK